MSETGYLLAGDAESRLDSLSAIFDPVTIRHFDRIGVAPGWRCWEVGAGGASIPRWLAARVGSTGHVTATDLDIEWARHAAGPNVSVVQHDVARDPPPHTGLDLVHARLVLVHVPDRAAALRAMVGALRPGGWLVLEDADPGLQPLVCLEPQRAEHVLANKLRAAFRALLAERGADLEFGRKLPRLLREAGLDDVAADGYFAIAGADCAALERKTIAKVRDLLVTSGRATATEVDEHLANIAAGLVDLALAPLISAWGRRP